MKRYKAMFNILIITLFAVVLVTDILMLSIAWTHHPFTFREIFDSLRECVIDLLRSRKEK